MGISEVAAIIRSGRKSRGLVHTKVACELARGFLMTWEQAEPCSEWPLRSLLKVEQHKDIPTPISVPHKELGQQEYFKSCGYQKKGNAKMLWFTDDTIRSRKPQGVRNDARQTRAQ